MHIVLIRVFLFFVAVSYANFLYAVANNEINSPERTILIAKPVEQTQIIIETNHLPSQINTQEQKLQNDLQSTEKLLNQAIENGKADVIVKLLKIYRTFKNADPLLITFAEAQIARKHNEWDKAIDLYRQILSQKPELTPVRVQLATALFYAQQDNVAMEQFEKSTADRDLPIDIRSLVQQYKQALHNRTGWKAIFRVNYLHDENVNNVSNDRNIEGTAFRKANTMLPQTANGIGYSLGVERDFNLFNSHYLHVENVLYGKNYWDNSDYNDVTNRIYLGYTHKSADKRWSILPFYERQWYGDKRYKWESGIRTEFNQWITPNWQISTALEYSKERYQYNSALNGNVKIASLTLLWHPNPRSYFFVGADFTQDKNRTKRYSYDLKTARIGWGQEWNWGISSRVSFSASQRHYKDNLTLGAVFYFNKARQDEIYHINATIWKRDWHLWGITPKLNYHWRKQHSNFNSLYSYSDKTVNIFFEKTF